MRRLLPSLALAAVLAAAGCFREPTPADATVDPNTRVYMKDAGLVEFSVNAVREKGRVFLGDEKGWANLLDRVESFDPASLDYLNLDYNALTNVDALAAFTGLRWLRLNENKLKTLPDFSGMKSLRSLHVRDNELTEVPATVGDLPELAVLDLSGNPISEIPEWFAKKEGMEHLSLSRTHLKRLPDDISAWKSLKSLQLGGLRLESIDELKRIRAALPDTAVVF